MRDDRTAMQIGEMASKIAASDLSAPADYRARQLRGFVQAGILMPTRHKGLGRNAAAEFDETGLCAARLFCTLADWRFDIHTLREAAVWMAAPARKKWPPNKIHPSDGLPAMVAGLKAGEDWDFVLNFARATDGGREIHGGFVHLSPDTPPESRRLVERAQDARGYSQELTIRLHCRGTFAPLLGLPSLIREDR